MLMKRIASSLLVLSWLAVFAPAQVTTAPPKLESGKTVEREIAVGESHTYQVKLTAGQFVRLTLQQKGIDVAVQLITPDSKTLVEVNFTDGFGQESLSQDVAVGGDYRIVIRTGTATVPKGAYEAKLELKAAANAQDKQRIEAERLLAEAYKSSDRGAAALEPTVEKAQQALSLWRGLGDRYWEAYGLGLVGYAYINGNKHDQAIEYYNQALAIRREVKDRYGEANTLSGLAWINSRLNRHEKAIEYYEQSLRISRELKDKSGVGAALLNLGFEHIQIGRYEKAIEYLDQSLAVRRELNDRRGEAEALYRLGFAHNWLSRFEKAIEYLEQALVIHRELKDRQWEADTLNGLGIFYNRLSRYEKGIEYSQQALSIARDLKFQFGITSALNNLGSANSSLGRYEKAIEYVEQSLALALEAKNRRSESNALNALGNQYLLTSRYEKAIGYYEQALRIAREVKWQPAEGRTLNNLGVAYANLERHERAIEYYEQALRIARDIKNRINEGNILSGLGDSYRTLGRLKEAIRFHEQAAFIAQEVKAKDKEADALEGLMLDWKARNQLRLAIFYGKQGVNVYQEIRSNIQGLDRELQQSFIKSNEETYRQLADLLIAQGRLPEAEQVIRMLKEEEYFDFIRRDQSNSSKAAKATLTTEEQAIEKRYHEIADHIAELGNERGALIDKKTRTAEEEQRLAKLDADLVVASTAFQKFLDGLAIEMGSNADANARSYQLRESQGLMEDLRQLGKGTVALYTLVGDDKYRVILTTADFQKGYEYPIKAADLNRKVLAFREVLQNPKHDPLPLAQELYKILLGPVAKDLEKAKAQVLMWSLDGVLRYLPVAALHDGKQYVVETYRNAVFTPASQSRLLLEPSRKWTALGLGVTKAQGDRIPALPGVAEEMHGIIKDEQNKSGVLPGTIKLDEAFTQEAMLTELRKRNPVVHIASHFQFSPGNETNSALLLGDGKFLSLAQIKSLPNVFGGVDLLTLSACNTATGGSGANGKEVEGFAVLAQRQGAKAVIASLWPVFDSSTKVLMQDLYTIREANVDTTKAEALRQAQLRLLRGEALLDGATAKVPVADRQVVHEEKPEEAIKPRFTPDPKKPYAHPYYWAPFILIGNWK
jgi:CHAT domain-containing protein/Flp pilus assembly protein TadD